MVWTVDPHLIDSWEDEWTRLGVFLQANAREDPWVILDHADGFTMTDQARLRALMEVSTKNVHWIAICHSRAWMMDAMRSRFTEFVIT